MRNTKSLFILLIFILTGLGCDKTQSVKDELKSIIHQTYYSPFSMNKIKDLNILKDDIVTYPVHYSMIENYQTNKDKEYCIVRYIFKTKKGVARMFYLINLTDKAIIDKSRDYNDFYKLICEKIFGQNGYDHEGNNLVEIMRYQ